MGNRKGRTVNSNKGGQKPIRIQRHEHKKRVAQLNTDSTIKQEPEEIKEDPDFVVVDEARSTTIVSGAPRVEDIRVKAEPATDPSIPPLPDYKQSLSELEDLDASIKNGEAFKIEAKVTSASDVKPRKLVKKEKKPVIQTAEDKAEYERHMEDMKVLKDELGNMHTSQPQTRDEEGNIQVGAVEGNKEGRLYLFQFPPVLPKLYNPLTEPKPMPPGHNPITINDDKDADMKPVAGSGTKNTVDPTKGKQPIKSEDGETILKEEDVKRKDFKKGREQYVQEEGYIGKMIVRESGRVELDWGGTRMLVGRGIPTGFLTTGVLLDPMDDQEQDNGQGGAFGSGLQPLHEGKAVGMGEIMGKFVVTPDWEKMM